MVLWTVQHVSVYHDLMSRGYYQWNGEVNPSTKGYYFEQAYKWMSSQMRSLIPPEELTPKYPVWGWFRQNGKINAPNIKRLSLREENYPRVLLVLDIPRDKVLLSDLDKWNYVINNMYMYSDNDDKDEIDNVIRGMSEEESLEYKMSSWFRVFDCKNSLNIQGTFWEIKSDYIKKVHLILPEDNLISDVS